MSMTVVTSGTSWHHISNASTVQYVVPLQGNPQLFFNFELVTRK